MQAKSLVHTAVALLLVAAACSAQTAVSSTAGTAVIQTVTNYVYPQQVNSNIQNDLVIPFIVLISTTMMPLIHFSSNTKYQTRHTWWLTPLWAASSLLAGASIACFWKTFDPTWGPMSYLFIDAQFKYYLAIVLHYGWVVFNWGWIYASFQLGWTWVGFCCAFSSLFCITFSGAIQIMYTANGYMTLAAMLSQAVIASSVFHDWRPATMQFVDLLKTVPEYIGYIKAREEDMKCLVDDLNYAKVKLAQASQPQAAAATSYPLTTFTPTVV